MDYKAITSRQQKVWSTGDFGKIAATSTLHAETLCESADIRAGDKVLDVAGGNGNTALSAARRFAQVTCSDYVPALLAQAAARAEAEGLPISTQIADAQDLPFKDGVFDVVTSTFGAMFAPDQQTTANELLRVCRSNGKIAMNNWKPNSLIGEAFRATSKYVPPPQGLRPAIEWGIEERVRELFGAGIKSLSTTTRQHTFRFHSIEHLLDFMRAWYGPTQASFNALDDTGKQSLARDLAEVYGRYNKATDGRLVAPSDYLEVIAVRA